MDVQSTHSLVTIGVVGCVFLSTDSESSVGDCFPLLLDEFGKSMRCKPNNSNPAARHMRKLKVCPAREGSLELSLDVCCFGRFLGAL